MGSSIFLAQAFSIYFLVIGIAMLFRPSYYRKAAVEMTQNTGVALLTSIVTLILGIILVLFHNLWVTDWRVIITILAWLTLIKGMLRMLVPVQVQKWVGVINNTYFYYSSIIFVILLGIYLAYLGF